jgi:hypothetical protein
MKVFDELSSGESELDESDVGWVFSIEIHAGRVACPVDPLPGCGT